MRSQCNHHRRWSLWMRTIKNIASDLLICAMASGLSLDIWLCSPDWFVLVHYLQISVQFSSVSQSGPTLCDTMNYSMPGLPVHHQLREFTQTHVELVMPSSHLILCRPLLLLPQSLPASGCFPMSQLFTWGGQSTGVSALASFLPKKSQGWSPPEWTGLVVFFLPSRKAPPSAILNSSKKHKFQPNTHSDSTQWWDINKI